MILILNLKLIQFKNPSNLKCQNKLVRLKIKLIELTKKGIKSSYIILT